MKAVLLSLVLVTFVAVLPPAGKAVPGSAAPMLGAVATLQAQSQDKAVNVDINLHGGGVWYRSPLWIGIGVLGVIVLLLIVVLASRGGGTTIIRE